jgi:hypothetical protein
VVDDLDKPGAVANALAVAKATRSPVIGAIAKQLRDSLPTRHAALKEAQARARTAIHDAMTIAADIEAINGLGP